MASVEFNTVIKGGEPSWSYESVNSIDFNDDFDPGWASELNYPPHWFDSINLDDNQAGTSTPITPNFPIYQLDPCESNLSSKTCYLSDRGEPFEEKTITDETNSYDDRSIFQKIWHNLFIPSDQVVMKGQSSKILKANKESSVQHSFTNPSYQKAIEKTLEQYKEVYKNVE